MSKSYNTQLLNKYKPPKNWKKGTSTFKIIIWFFIGRPLVGSIIPGTNWRKIILRLFGAKIGKGGRIKPYIQITYPWNLEVGDYCWIGEKVWIDSLAKVILEDNICISQKAFLCTGSHNYKKQNFDLLLGSITIKSEAWIAANTSIGPGTLIGERSIICLGSVVSGNVDADQILKGNPAVPIRNRK